MIAVGNLPLMTNVMAQALVPQADGTVVVVFPDGTLMSVQPGGGVETRPAGMTPGAYEKATLDGKILTFNPPPGAGHPWLAYGFAYTQTVANNG